MATLARQAVGNSRGTAAALLLLLFAVPVAYAATRRPLEVLLGVAAVALVVVCTIWIEFAVLLLVATGPLEFAITIGSNSQLTITKLAGIVCFVSFALNAVITRRRLIFDITHALVFLLLAIALVSMLHAQNQPAAIVTTTRYASFVALFFVVSQFVGGHRLQRRIAWALSIASCVTGILASWNFISGASLQAELPHGDPNDIAFALATTLPFTMWLLRERGIRRAAALAMTSVIAVSTLLTLSRGALVGLGAGLLWYTLFERRNARALVAGAIVIGIALFVAVHVGQSEIERGLNAKERIASTNVESRLEAWDAASHLAAGNPLLGVGPGNFGIRYLAATGHPPGTRVLSVVHNTYLDVAAELGLVALATFVGYLVLVFARLTASVRYRCGPPGLASACRISLIVGVLAALTLTEQYFAPFWLIGALATAMFHERYTARRTNEVHPNGTPLRTAQRSPT